MKIKDLKSTNAIYQANKDQWVFFEASYEGAKKLIDLGYIEKHERETQENYEKRMCEAYGFSYSSSVVDLLSYYLFKSTASFKIGKLGNDTLWDMFITDCDLYGNVLNDWFTDQQKEASKYGHMGILVDKPPVENITRQQEIDNKIYPYVSSYNPLFILDWEFKRDKFNRPYLSYLKLKEDDGQYRIWTIEKWEVWREITSNDKNTNKEDAILVGSGKNLLGIIPFVWLINVKKANTIIGISDIKDVAYIDVSIMRNLSQGEEIIDYSAFPMMRKPKSNDDDDVGVTAVLEFDPDTPDAKPDWLEAKCQEPIDAILTWMARKTAEIYRVVNVGGISATEVSKTAKSGVALKVEFQMLNSKLVKKGKNIASAKYQVIRYWLLWQQQTELIDQVSYITPVSYDVESLATDLQNALTAQTLIKSKMFSSEIQKLMARETLPGLKEDAYVEIDKEIDEYKPIGGFDINEDE